MNANVIRALGQRAYAHVAHLAAEIGPRPAGSAAEAAALDYAADQLRGWGYTPVSQPAPFAPIPRFSPVYVSGGAALLLGGALLTDFPLAAVLPVLWIAVLPDVAREIIRRRPRFARSRNVLAYTAGPESAPTLVLCAHVDSAPASAFRAPALLWLRRNAMFLALRVAWALAALALLHVFVLPLPEVALSAVGGVAVLAGGGWAVVETLDQVLRGEHYAPGAHDNASGVGVLLAAAEQLAAAAVGRLRVGFLFTGAEETGLHGAEAAVAQFQGRRAAVLSVDMVGAGGRLHFITRDGVARVRAADERLNDVIRAACPEARGLEYTLRSGDLLPFLRSGVPAGALQTSGSLPAEEAYHTLADTLEVIELEALGRTTQAVLDILTQAEKRGYPEFR